MAGVRGGRGLGLATLQWACIMYFWLKLKLLQGDIHTIPGFEDPDGGQGCLWEIDYNDKSIRLNLDYQLELYLATNILESR
jgi:hypothetical protein